MTMPCHNTILPLSSGEEPIMTKDQLYTQLAQARKEQAEGNYTLAKPDLQERIQQVKKKYHV